MTYLQEKLASVHRAFPDAPIEALKAAMMEGIETFAWWKDGIAYVGTSGRTFKEAATEIMEFLP